MIFSLKYESEFQLLHLDSNPLLLGCDPEGQQGNLSARSEPESSQSTVKDHS